jgi:peptidylprolyl isomerase
MPKRPSDSIQSLRQENRKREKQKNKKARTSARSVEAIRDNPKAVRDEIKRLRILDQQSKLDAPGKEKMQELSQINREFSLAKYAREEQARKELATRSGGSGTTFNTTTTNTTDTTNSNHHNHRRKTHTNNPNREQQGPIIYRPGGFVPPPPPPPPGTTHSNDPQRAVRRVPPPQRAQRPSQAVVVPSQDPATQFLQPPPPPPRFHPIAACHDSTYQILTPGIAGGAVVIKGGVATLHAVGRVRSARKPFWSTKDPGQQVFSTTFGVGNVIAGWDHGCLGMRVGEHRRLIICAQDGYGARGFPAWGIAGGATLEFTLECMKADGHEDGDEELSDVIMETPVVAEVIGGDVPPPPPPPRRASHISAVNSSSFSSSSSTSSTSSSPPPPPPPPRPTTKNEKVALKSSSLLPPASTAAKQNTAPTFVPRSIVAPKTSKRGASTNDNANKTTKDPDGDLLNSFLSSL